MVKRKILFFVPTLNRGGAERVISTLANYFSDKFDVTIITLSSDVPQYDISAKYKSLNANAYEGGFMKIINIFIRFIRIRRIIKKEQPSAVISFMESANIPVILATRILKWKGSLIISVRNNPLKFPWYYRLLIKILYRFPGRVVAPSLGIKKDLERIIYSHKGIDFIPNPINVKKIKSLSQMRISDIPNLPEKYILAVGRLAYQKGFDRLISIFSKIPNKDLSLVIIGEGDLRSDLNHLIRCSNLENRVIMPGLTENPFPIYKSAICLALTSRYEGWPNVINEAIASGCPVVSYDCKYGPSEILNNNNGLLVPEGNEEEFISSITSLIENPDICKTIIDNGFKNINRYSIERIAQYWLKIANLTS